MDDPWANAWGETSKPVLDHIPAATSSWLPASPPANTNDQETDIAMPSWATGAGIQWDEPPDSHGSLWKRDSLPAAGWEPQSSPYETIPIGQSSPQSSSPPEQLKEHSPSASPIASPLTVQVEELPPSPDSPGSSFQPPVHSPPSSPLPASLSAPTSPDAFGTFETALEVDEAELDPWSPAKTPLPLPSADADAWGASWSGPQSATTVEEESETVDEWEAAKQQKEKQDRLVPPELLASIIQQFEELAGDLWPQADPNVPSQEFNRSDDIVESLGLAAVVNRLIPQDLVLPPYTQFSKTFTRKSTNEALRLTRNLPVSRSSPMTKYMASKGSTSWEAFIKSQPDVAQEDVAPSGWRLLEKKDEEVSPVDDGKKKTGGGLLSFFGRKTASSDGTSSVRSASPSRPPSTPPIPKVSNASTPRASVDVVKSRPATPTPANARASSPSPTASSFASASEIKPPEPSPAPSTSSVTSPSQSDIPQAPSAVSRFLGRFSRSKSSISPRNSIALSSDDLEFLSDIVPSASDDSDHDVSLGALTSMIESSPLPTKLPAPLAPPPRPPPLAPPSRPPQPPIVKATPQKSLGNDDFASFFNAPPSKPLAPISQPSVQESMSRPRSPAIPSITSHPIVPQAPKEQQSVSPNMSGSTSDDAWASFDFDFAGPATASATRTPASQPRTASVSRTQTPPVPQKRTVTAIMSNKPSSHSPVPSLSGFAFPSPPSSSRPQGSRAASQVSIPSLPPPPTSRVHTPLPARPISPPRASLRPPQPPPLVTQSTTADDDDFADFLSSPAEGTGPTISLDSSFASAFSDQSTPSAKLVSGKSNVGFDDFDDFVSSPLRTPSPPRPPAKPPTFSFKPPPPLSSASGQSRAASPAVPKAALPRRTSRAADHQRTLSLLETAAARGKWPAPPSPLPEAIPPPEPPRNANSSKFDIFGDEPVVNQGSTFSGRSTMQAQQANAMASLTPSIPPPSGPPANGSNGLSQWKFPLPMNNNLNVLQPSPSSRPTSPPTQAHTPIPGSFGGQNVLKSMSLTSNPTSPASGKSGGLSAQDLSFFEGL